MLKVKRSFDILVTPVATSEAPASTANQAYHKALELQPNADFSPNAIFNANFNTNFKHNLPLVDSAYSARVPGNVKLIDDDEDVSMEDESEATNVSDDRPEPDASNDPWTMAMEKAELEHDLNVKAHLVSAAKESTALRAYYGSDRFKQDQHDYREACRPDIGKVITAILKIRNYLPDRHPTDEDLENIIRNVDEDISVRMVVDELTNTVKYDWVPCLKMMNEVNKHLGPRHDERLKSKQVSKRRKKIAKALYQQGFLGLKLLSGDDQPRRWKFSYLEWPG
ncbi:hypothetical protein BGZ83_007017 [Gryganskiella cystojenkinii]|nr:hypothetical protein BGZ83_007017 [Gryganskiella cystojenkinii]